MRKQTFILVLTVLIDMMGFSLIFPIFPETLSHFLAQAGDPILDLFTSWTSTLLTRGETDWKLFVALFGGIVASLYSILQFLFAPIWGKLSDRVGRRPVLVFTCTGSLIGYFVWLLSGSFSLFVLSRIITGLMGGNISVATAAMADTTDEKNRAKGMGMIGAGIGLGFIAGPSIGGILAHTNPSGFLPFIPWESMTIFPSVALAAFGVALLNLLLVFFYFHETLPIGIRKKPEGRLHPILGVLDIGSREVLSASLLYFLFVFAFSGFEFSLNFYLNQFLGFSPKSIGYTFVYIGMIIVLVQGGVVRKLSGKVPEKKIGIFAGILLIIGFFLLSVGNSHFYLFLALTFLATGSALLHPALSTIVSLFSLPQDQGKNLGIFRSLASLGRGIAPIAFCLIYSQEGPEKSFFVSGILSVFFLVLFGFIKQPLHGKTNH
ncbi:MFS transporter [Leptospira perolatii]|uniref:MFS transporter n=1 Tax=Leptospira perolatii TaxID=2023191 RepID=A0A2M9ZMQ6_9LEPT|nr:MFS transporter [Leptospira perolatii]PJZ70083.1 MFS transporter [Leptospira perolatii]PJZ73271.1 MFS transporter [Leptospira perolatii]